MPPSDPASLLGQIGDLIQQYLALPGATPLDHQFQAILPDIEQGMQSTGAEGPADQAGDAGPETPAEDMGEGGPPPSFKSAREAALPALRKMKAGQDKGSKAPPDEGDGTDPKKKGKRTKAPSY